MTRKIEQVKPLHGNRISLYTCGMTVYDYPQLGNWATYVRWDTLVRTLRESGFDVTWVMNITDVGHLTSDADEGEDKLEKGARREGKTAWEIADFYTNVFLDGMRALNITMPTHLPKATDTIDEQIALLQKLEAKGFTYTIDDGVYFDTSKLEDYGKLARLKLDDLRAGARVEINKQKRNPTDFALWKFSPKDTQRDMEWDSPWGKGFPGWHLECSAIAIKFLGETLDIHAGGIDHIPVHHTNEIAQSEAATGKPFSNLWLHSNFITVDGVKLSKSLGNSFTLSDIEKRGYTPLDLRMLLLQSHYRSEANFTWEGLQSAKARLQKLRNTAALRWQPKEEATSVFDFEQKSKDILNALQDDLNTPIALSILGFVHDIQSLNAIGKEDIKKFIKFLEFIDRVFGLKLMEQPDITDEQKSIIAKRETARKHKDFAESDKLRAELESQRIGLNDTPHGPLWYRM
jgi:cysteinyl-tRNA synthetase